MALSVSRGPVAGDGKAPDRLAALVEEIEQAHVLAAPSADDAAGGAPHRRDLVIHGIVGARLADRADEAHVAAEAGQVLGDGVVDARGRPLLVVARIVGERVAEGGRIVGVGLGVREAGDGLLDGGGRGGAHVIEMCCARTCS